MAMRVRCRLGRFLRLQTSIGAPGTLLARQVARAAVHAAAPALLRHAACAHLPRPVNGVTLATASADWV